MLRKFVIYRPLQVARFVKTLFKGEFFIDGVGVFYFNNGKILLPDLKDKKKLSIMKEVNVIINTLSNRPEQHSTVEWQ